ncbi:MAG: aldehyde ferredoxin oxidoreductase [Desulfococcus sp. 4484_241]|nr:MAG: aldehyde ferredoxin oxidoreductase [Desulfococcus sp. 4484_241]
MKKELAGPSERVLVVDLSGKKFEVYDVPRQLRKMYLGGKGLGLKLIFDRMDPGTDPLGSENIIAFMPGVLMGTGAPCTGRFAAVTKSPLTGIMVTSSCGGPFGMQLKTAGWDGLLITGKADSPVYIEVTSEGVLFMDAASLWGATTDETQQRLASDKRTGVLAIGPAGENMVRFANIASGHRFLGRGGMGAVMGSKNLKAVVARGRDYRIRPMDAELFNRVKQRALKYINSNEMTSATYRNYGTRANVNPCNKANILPVNNFSDGSHDMATNISGEEINKNHDTSHSTCKPCSILCGQKGNFGGRELPVPEFETVGLLGSNLGIFDPVQIAEFNRICGEMGMDTISAGGTIAWVMEASEKGLVDTPLRFGDPKSVEKALMDIANMEGFGKEMAMGTRALSEKYGGKEFAIQVKGLEMAAYDPRGSFGQGLAYAVANRGACHLSAYLIAQEIYFKMLNPRRTYGKPEFVKFFESLTCCVNSLHTCQFTMFAYLLEPPAVKKSPDRLLAFFMQNTPGIAVKLTDFGIYTKLWQSVTGIPMSNSEFLRAGDRIHVLERYMNTQMGISRKDDTLPERLLKEGRKSDPENLVVPLESMLDKYYRLRGYDSNGIPTKETLKKLKIID